MGRSMAGWLARLSLTAATMRETRALADHETWTAADLAAFQRRRLGALLRHAALHSPYYRERLAAIALDDDVDLESLPTLDKPTMLRHFDAIVTDPRLKLTELERHVESLQSDALYLDEYRVMSTGGTSGRRGIFVYGRRDWIETLAGLTRFNQYYVGASIRLPRRRRVAVVAAAKQVHMTARMGASIDIGAHRLLRLDARTPVPALVAALNTFRPEVLVAYASVAALLAEEQLDGRLSITPELVATSSEVRTPEMTARIRAAWGRAPFDCYASTETGILAGECAHHTGLHVYTDQTLLEVVDEQGRPVPPGVEGQCLLVTNLVNRTQPLIRYQLTDRVTVLPEPCSCGRPFPLLAAIDGRSDDLLKLPGRSGGVVTVHPIAIRSPLATLAGLREYRVVLDREGLTIEAVLDPASESDAAQIPTLIGAALAECGAAPPPVHVRPVAEIARHPVSGKKKLVESRL
jgi:phenylacetate-CoA ligase